MKLTALLSLDGSEGSFWVLPLVNGVFNAAFPSLSFQITGQAHVSHKSIIRCARGS